MSLRAGTRIGAKAAAHQRRVAIAATLCAALLDVHGSAGQSLGDAAKRANEGRQTQPSRVYSNADLERGDTATSTPTGDPPGNPQTGPVATAALGPSPSREAVVRAVGPAVVTIETARGRGSGFFVAPHLVLTNRHVIEGSSSLRVTFADGSAAHGYVRTEASDADLAIVRVDDAPDRQVVLEMGTATTVRVGQEVLAIGSALGVLHTTVTRGIVSAVRVAGGLTLVQTDAAINPGNSGGPLVDARGRVVGITTAKMASAESIGFALAIDHARPLVRGTSTVAAAQSPVDDRGDRALDAAFGGTPAGAADDLRRQGLQRYEQVVQTLALRADETDALWERYRAACSGSTAAARSTGAHPWLSLLENSAFRGDPRPSCRQWATDIADIGARINDAMLQSQDDARRAGVFPGAARDIRRKHRMDWPGWDR